MKNLIPISNDESGKQTVNARDLHIFLGSKQDFSTWIKKRISDYGFSENEDFLKLHKKMELSITGQVATEYHISLDMAKELSMVERNDKGKEARRYFIKCEKMLTQTKLPQLSLPTDPVEIAKLIIAQAESHKIEKSQIADKRESTIMNKLAKEATNIEVGRICKESKATCDRLSALRPKDIGIKLGISAIAVNNFLMDLGFQNSFKAKVDEKIKGKNVQFSYRFELSNDGHEYGFRYLTRIDEKRIIVSYRWDSEMINIIKEAM